MVAVDGYSASVAFHYWREHAGPVVRAVHIPLTQQTAFQITVLVEQEQRMIAVAAEVPIVGSAFLIPVRGALRAVHVQDQFLHLQRDLNSLHPAPRQVHQRGQVVLACQDFRLEPAHLAGGRAQPLPGPAADRIPHGRIEAQALRIVGILVPGEPAQHGLPKQRREGMLYVQPEARVSQGVLRHCGQAEHVVQFPVRQEPGIAGYLYTVEF